MSSAQCLSPDAESLVASDRSEASLLPPFWMCPSGYDTPRGGLPFRAIARLFPHPNTVITMKPTFVFALLWTLALAGTASAQRAFEWQPGNDEAVRLDPANYHTGKTYTAGGGIHADIESPQPGTSFLSRGRGGTRALRAYIN